MLYSLGSLYSLLCAYCFSSYCKVCINVRLRLKIQPFHTNLVGSSLSMLNQCF